MCGFFKYADQEQDHVFKYICYIKALILFFPYGNKLYVILNVQSKISDLCNIKRII